MCSAISATIKKHYHVLGISENGSVSDMQNRFQNLPYF